MSNAERLLGLVQDEVDTETWKSLHWEGSFKEYLDLCYERPLVVRNAFQRIYDMIMSYGFDEYTEHKDRRIRYRFFSDPEGVGDDAIYGLDSALMRLVDTMKAGAHGYGPEKRIMLLHGPVGSSKSTIVRLLKRGLQQYSRSEEGALYTYSWVLDNGEELPCPMNEEPLKLIPESVRGKIMDEFNERCDREFALKVIGDLNPMSRYYYNDFMKQHDGDWTKVLEHVRVRRLVLSEKDRVGIGTFQPKDEKNQDSTELTGDLNYRKIAEYGSDSDARAFNFDGEFNVANRGMLEFVEVLKLDVAFLYDLLGATQEHSIKPRKFPQTHIDEVIIGHTNEPEYKKLQSNDLMEAFRDRTIKIDIPYNLAASDEVKIYERQFGSCGSTTRSVAPHTFEVAALWATLTRMEDPTHPTLSLLQKARLYDGKRSSGFGTEQIAELRRSAPREGMNGISPRYVQDSLANCLVSDG